MFAARYFPSRYYADRYWPKAAIISGGVLGETAISFDLYLVQARAISMFTVRNVSINAYVAQAVSATIRLTQAKITDFYISKQRSFDLERQ